MSNKNTMKKQQPERLRLRQRRKRSGLGLVSTTVVALMVAYGVTPSQCFHFQSAHSLGLSSSLSVTEPRVSTRRFFRDTADAASTVTATAVTATAHPFVVNVNSPAFKPSPPQLQVQVQQHQPKPKQQRHHHHHSFLPTWLATPKDSQWESNWHTLEEAMLESFFTPQETQRLLHTIDRAANGDRHQMASAAEFCWILVDTMEMGLTALMAAAYHVCACVTARQTTVDLLAATATTAVASQLQSQSSSQHHNQIWDDAFSFHSQFINNHNQDVVSINMQEDHVASIARDAGRLKSLEMVAAMIYSDKAASRVTPDAQDAENLRSLLLTETKDWRALAIRSAAALYRLRGIIQHSTTTTTTSHHNNNHNDAHNIAALTHEALQCSREALYIYAPLASRLGMHRLKNELEGAAFRILYRRQYDKVNRLARELRPRHSKPHLNRGLVEMCDNSLDISSCMKNVLQTVKTDMDRLLRNDAHFAHHVQDFSVTARVKEPYSLWKKMLRNKCQHIMEVPDAIALRIVLEAKRLEGEDDAVHKARERALCYYAQKLCMEHWHPVQSDPRFKDYIDHPKRNGYQSLHYTAHTVWDKEDWFLEIQVRSGEMHQVAEFGLASHWDYKAQQKRHHHHHQNHQQQHQQQHRPEVSISSFSSSGTANHQPQHQHHHHHQSSTDAYLRSVQEWHWQQHAGKAQQRASYAASNNNNNNNNAGVHHHHHHHHNQWMVEDDYEQTTDHDTHQEPVEHNSNNNNNNEYSSAAAATVEATETRADRIRARTKKLQPYIEALTAAQSDLAREHVFVFLTSEDDNTSFHGYDDANQHEDTTTKQPGRVLALPAGACVLDALREGEREFGFAFPDQVRINGEISSKVTLKLQNGDILTVPVQRGGVSNTSSTTAAMAS